MTRAGAALVGAGMIRFGERFELGYYEMVERAVAAALDDADGDLGREDVEAAWLGTAYGTLSFDAEIVSGARLAEAAGLPDIPITRVENACATGSDAVRNAALAIESGRYDVALVVGAEKMRDRPTSAFLETVANRPGMRGMTAAAFFAMYARRHMDEYGTTREQMAEVAVKNHENGTRCEYSHFSFPVTVEEVLEAPVVSAPFGLYDCAPQTDGAAALVLASPEAARSLTDAPVWLRGFGNATVPYSLEKRDDYLTAEPTVQAARQAYDMAGLGPEAVDVVEQHDCFSFTELLNMEDLGFCEKGQGGPFVASGQTRLDGDLPVNPSGGLKAKGHPIGATGVGQLCELFWQLRGEAGDRQVSDAEVGLQHNLAGSLAVSNVTLVSTGRD